MSRYIDIWIVTNSKYKLGPHRKRGEGVPAKTFFMVQCYINISIKINFNIFLENHIVRRLSLAFDLCFRCSLLLHHKFSGKIVFLNKIQL